jgi:UTP:GlnB (protein PII) uridylyltransferase
MMFADRDYECLFPGNGDDDDDDDGDDDDHMLHRSWGNARRRRNSSSSSSSSSSSLDDGKITVDDCHDKGYSVVNVECRDRPKLLFDTLCTLTDMEYVIFHATIDTDGHRAFQVRLQFQGLMAS